MTTTPNRKLGILSVIGVFFIWSSFFVISRVGTQTPLTAFDLTALRFLVAGSLVLPFAWRWWPRHLPPAGIFTMAVCGPGALYSMIMYSGLASAPVAYAGVFANGSLPVFSLLVVWLVRREAPVRNQVLGILIILAGSVMLSAQGLNAGGDNLLSGIAFFLLASAILSIYLFGVRHWSVAPREALALITIPNMLVFLPVWFFALPSGLAETNWPTILAQALFQGLGPGFLAVLLFALATIHLGPTVTAGFAASVPAGATLLAIPTLAEIPTPLEWMGIVIVTLGLALTLTKRSARIKPRAQPPAR